MSDGVKIGKKWVYQVTVTWLDITNTSAKHLGIEGVKLVTSLLIANHKSLDYLRLFGSDWNDHYSVLQTDCGISDEELSILMKAFKVISVGELHLIGELPILFILSFHHTGNKISDKGAKLLSEWISNNNTLIKLYLHSKFELNPTHWK